MYIIRVPSSNGLIYITKCLFRGLPSMNSIEWNLYPENIQVFTERSSFECIKKEYVDAQKIDI